MQEIKYQPEREEASVSTALAVANRHVIKTQDDLEVARDILRQVKALGKEIIAHHEPIKKAALETHRTAVAAEKKLLDPLQQAEAVLKGKASAFLVEQERIAQEAARQEELRLQAERDKKVAAAQGMVTKLLASAAKDSEKLALLEKQLDEVAEEEEAGVIRSQIAILRAKLEGGQAKAQDIEMDAVQQVFERPNVQAESMSVAGLSSRGKVEVEVVNMVELCKAIGEGKVGDGVVKPVNSVLVALAKSGMKLPGCKITRGKTIAVR